MQKSLLKHIATLGPVGYIPFAPGTFGTLAGLIFAWISPLTVTADIFILIVGALLGSIAATSAEAQIKEKDSKKIVIDEFIGFLVGILFIPRTPGLLFAAFLLFRFFDILKPLMIRKLEKSLKNGIGVMADDILAGIYTNLLLQSWLYLSKGF